MCLGRFSVDKNSYDMWKEIRAQGKFKYIFKTGVLKFSLPFAIILSVFLAITYAKNLSHILTFWFLVQSIAESFFIILLIGIPIGILYGIFLWWFKERAYRNYKK
jgi:hypothetical protein